MNHAHIPPDAIPITRERTLGESATQFAQGFGKGVRDETAQMYRDETELPHHVATTGRELLEDIQAGRKLRAIAGLGCGCGGRICWAWLVGSSSEATSDGGKGWAGRICWAWLVGSSSEATSDGGKGWAGRAIAALGGGPLFV